jgi:hypothetical protein
VSDETPWSIHSETTLRLTDGSTLTGATEDITVTPFGVEILVARFDDPSKGTEAAARKFLYPWHRVASLESSATAVTNHPGGQWTVTFGKSDASMSPDDDTRSESE